MKIDRRAVYKKTDGRCAYCGNVLEFKQMQVDHWWPQFLAHLEPDKDNNRFENLMPACQKCNLHKHGMRPEVWRSELKRQVSMLKNNAQFQRALRFGQVEIVDKPIVFYFEKIGLNDNFKWPETDLSKLSKD
jgi:hypothetical protein